MQAALVGIARAIEHHRRAVLAIWLVLVAAAVPFALRQSEDLTGSGFGVPGSESDAVRGAIERSFPGAARAQLAIVLDGNVQAALTRLPGQLDGIEDAVPAPAPPVVRDGVAVVALIVRVGEERAPDVAEELRDALHAGERRDGTVAHVIGLGAFVTATGEVLERDLRSAEAIGFPVVLLILLLAFGSIAAALLPLALGMVTLTVTGALIFWISQAVDVYLLATNIASLVGIGVAIDYSLFVVVRYREELRAGADPASARARALATSGESAVFSGATVIVSLAAIWTVNSSALRSLALGAILVVAVAVVATVALLPALLGLLGQRATRVRRARGSGTFWRTWTSRVVDHPVRALIPSALLVLLLATPALSLDIKSGILEQLPADHEARAGFEKAARVVGPGAAGQAQVVVRDAALAGPVRAVIASDPAVAGVGPATLSDDGRSALIAVTPREQPESESAKAMVDRLRDTFGAGVSVGGVPAQQLDYERQISGSMWRIVLVVLVVCFTVLVILLRSLVVPLKAVVVNLLSVGAAYGVIVVVFQWGWLDGLIGYDSPGHVDPSVPPILFALVFGLSMDYEVFLLTRVRERWEATGDTRAAVADALASSAGPISSAAAIMVAVFASFALTGVPAIQMLGLGAAVAVALDATLVRLVLVPSTMALLGDANWWLPRLRRTRARLPS